MLLNEITAKQFMKKLKDPVRARQLETIAKIRAALKDGGYKMERVKLAKKADGFATKLRFEVPVEAAGTAFENNAISSAKNIVENSLPADAMIDDIATLHDREDNTFISFVLYLDISDSYE